MIIAPIDTSTVIIHMRIVTVCRSDQGQGRSFQQGVALLPHALAIARRYNGSHVTIGRLQRAMVRLAAGVVLRSERAEHMHEDERCPDCGTLLILVGRSHLCRPRQAVTKRPVTKSGGRPPIGEKAMIGAERMRKLRATRRALAHI
jgi:hypothetical protein